MSATTPSALPTGETRSMTNTDCPQCSTAGMIDATRTERGCEKAYVCPNCETEYSVTQELISLP
jgi:predicted RNA-binding Zn-ribbon protein involved in translation (DUF1610 family)